LQLHKDDLDFVTLCKYLHPEKGEKQERIYVGLISCKTEERNYKRECSTGQSNQEQGAGYRWLGIYSGIKPSLSSRVRWSGR
jgi:hypothetical protein